MRTDVISRIQRLPPSVVNKIAAGEVIERPGSVVKELLENSIDAGATRIDVEIEQGGADLIRVVDDGEGIHPDDVELAVTSHCTSKLIDADHLFHISTLGFRGEALASIAEVSRFRLRTRQREQPGGVELTVAGGAPGELRLCGSPVGTLIEVRQLFYNTPVRRKFLKTASTEFAHIVEQFTRIALAHPQVHMTLRHMQRMIHDLPPTPRLLDRIEMFFGGELSRQLIHVEAEHGLARISGYAAHPSQTRGTRKGQYLFLNGRWIQDRSLQHALGEAYRGLVMVGRYPVAFLFLELSPELVDVNVHPTKAEVRFQDSQSLYRLMLSTLRNRFLSMDLDSKLAVDRLETITPPARDLGPLQQELATWARNELSRQVEASSLGEGQSHLFAPPRDEMTVSQRAPDAMAGVDFPAEPERPRADVVHAATADSEQRPTSSEGTLRAMQVHDCYLVVETREGITVIDQHALHERILYEQLRKRVLAGRLEIQKLLIPVTVELSGREAAVLLDHADLLAELGVLVQDFGGQTIAISGYPSLLARAEPAGLLQDLVEQIETSGRQIDRRDLLDRLLHMMSCKAAIKAGQRLSLEEIESLLAQRHLCDDAHHCPHGRPTALKLTRAELDKQFGRLG